MARMVADKMSKTLGQQIVIENRGGAGGTIATRAGREELRPTATRSLSGTGSLAINPSLYPECRLRSAQGFRAHRPDRATSAQRRAGEPVAAGAFHRGTDRARQEGPRQAQLRLGRHRQRHPSRRRYCSQPWPASSLTHIPYKGIAPALTDLIGGHVADLCSAPMPPRGRAGAGRQGARARGHRQQALGNISRICRRWRKQDCPATRPCCITALSRPPVRRGRSSKSSTPRCARL